MKKSKYEILKTKQFCVLNFGYSILFSISILVFSIYALSPSPSFAMGSAPAKTEPKYKVDILKMEVVGKPSTIEVTLPRKALIISTGDYKDIKDGLEAKGYQVTVLAKVGRKVKAKDYAAIVVVGQTLGQRALWGLK
jgi:hypothetical protein